MVSRSAASLDEIVAELGVSTAADLKQHDALPVHSALTELFPDGMRRGSTIGVRSTSLLYSLLAGPTSAGSWAAVVGFPRVGVVAAAEQGVELTHCVFVPDVAQSSITKVLATLIDSVDMVVVQNTNAINASDARRLVARARERRCVLVLYRTVWQELTPLTLQVASVQWLRTAEGHGRLRGRWMNVAVDGRGAMSRPLRTSMWVGDGREPSKTIDLQGEMQKRAV